MIERSALMRQVWLAAGAMIMLSVGARAQTAPAPTLVANDNWTYLDTTEVGTNWHQIHQEISVTHAGAGSIGITSKEVGSTAPPRDFLTGPDWSRVRSVNGQQTVVNRPLAFPLSVGKSWKVEYTEQNPNRQHSSEHITTPYKVVGWEDVTVPAGTFHALKIEADGEWSAVVAPSAGAIAGTRVDGQGATIVTQTNRTQTSTIGGRTYRAFWYVPSVKRWVKSVEETYSTTGARSSSYRSELESFKPAG